MNQHVFVGNQPLRLECGEVLHNWQVAYTTYGSLNAERSNVVWVFHALTGSSAVLDWWPGLFGTDRVFDPQHDFIVCVNMLGSCYGSTVPDRAHVPVITIRDMVEAHKQVHAHLGLGKISVGIGGSMGGQQLLEWAVQSPDLFNTIIPMATNAVHSAWGIAFNEAQRMALEHPDEAKGLAAARAIGMLSYRGYDIYNLKQTDSDERLDGYSAGSYQQYQGQKLADRFSRDAYYYLSKAMDSHDVGRGRGGRERVLQGVRSRAIVFGFETDLLFPIEEQMFLAKHIPISKLHSVKSSYAHDGFLVEVEQINTILRQELCK
jgi:homoserine O-acetyltransferase